MAAFLKNLAKMLSPTKASGPAGVLGAFGKHPGWNDHIDDLGLETEELITAKQLLYAQGINGAIDAGAWEKLEPAQRLSGFAHEFLWRTGRLSGDLSALLAGGLWASVDGKGRDKYPMVICAGLRGLDTPFAVQQALPIVQAAHDACVAVRDAQSVRNTIEQEGVRLRTAAATADASPSLFLRGSEVVATAKTIVRRGGPEAFTRILYQFVTALSAYRPGGTAVTGKGSRRSEQLRVPRLSTDHRSALLFWFTLACQFVDDTAPLLLITPQAHISLGDGTPSTDGWVDIIVGEPTVQNVFCLKASSKSLPFTSDIPYTLDSTFCQKVAGWVSACENAGANPAPAVTTLF